MSARAQSLAAPALPQVNLLPPEITAARGLTRVKRWLVFLILVSMVGAVGLVALAMMTQAAAEAELAVHEQRTEELLSEQLKYAEVPVVLGALDQASAARRVGMSTEVLWRQYFAAIAATTPEGVRIETLQVAGGTPMQLPPDPADALSAPAVATVTFTAQSATLPDTEAWVVSLATIPGFADAWFTTHAIAERDGVVFYDVIATVQVNERAFALRFADDEEAEE